MTIKLIVAVDQGGAIGWTNGCLPWKLPADMRRFKELTTGNIVVMGFNTFKSLNMPNGLPNRENYVLSRKNPKHHIGEFGDDISVISSLDYVKQINHRAESALLSKDIWIIGGASVYEEALKNDLVSQIYLTLVHTTTRADVKLTTDVVAWKRFVLTERKRGVEWNVEALSRQWDGDVETSYLTLTRQ